MFEIERLCETGISAPELVGKLLVSPVSGVAQIKEDVFTGIGT